MNKKKDIDFLYEIGNLKKVTRAWQQVITAKVSNVSEHIFRTTYIAWIIAAEEKADINKVLKICLLHDIAESRTGDIAFMHRDYVVRHENLAQEHILKNTAIEKEAKALLNEYEERKTLEAKIVKDADNIDVDLELRELAKLGDPAAEGMRKKNRPVIRAEKLYTKTAKRMWDQIQSSNPDNWHQTLTDKWVKNKKSAK